MYSHKRKHDPDYKNKYSCSVCQYSNDNIHHLYSHINTHDEATIITNERKLYRKPNKHRKSKINENDQNFFHVLFVIKNIIIDNQCKYI